MRKIYLSLLLLSFFQTFSQVPELVKDINTSDHSYPKFFHVYQGKLYFWADNQFWVTDGTTAGTQMVTDIQPYYTGYAGYYEYQNKLYFSAEDNQNSSYGYELYVSDGTAGGTMMVKDINPGSLSSYTFNYQEINGKMFFRATDADHGNETWITDGTESGTHIIKDLDPVPGNGINGSFAIKYNGQIYFDGFDHTSPSGACIWSTDGTEGGTVLVKKITYSFGIKNGFVEYNGKFYFTADSPNEGYELWVSDGTENGTSILKDIWPGYMDSDPGYLKVYKGRLWFSANDGINGVQLWSSDGTASGTSMFMNINPGGDSAPYGFTEYNGLLYFTANDGIHGMELWTTDGTVGNTKMFMDINPTDGSWPSALTLFSNFLAFTADDGGSHFYEYYYTDGTQAGTKKITSPNNYSETFYEAALANYNNSLFMQANYDDTYGYELYKLSSSNGVDELEHTVGINVSPNPNTGKFSITADIILPRVEITNVFGTNVFSADIKDFSAKINLQGQPAGIYLYRVMDNGKVLKTGKVIVE